jgi:hypothetical protein
MEQLKKTAGLLWMALGPVTIGLLLYAAFKNINSSAQGDITNPVPWIIVITIFTPIAIGLVVFGLYCWKGEYSNIASENERL